jgi:hypothetical protein
MQNGDAWERGVALRDVVVAFQIEAVARVTDLPDQRLRQTKRTRACNA